jgi:hypothetical protein
LQSMENRLPGASIFIGGININLPQYLITEFNY